MIAPILNTKLYTPHSRSDIINRPQLVKRLDEGRKCKLTLVSAPPGFGKTTLVSEWATGSGSPVAWLSLDADDNDLLRFLSYFISALQAVDENIGEGMLEELNSLQTIGLLSVLTNLVNYIIKIPDEIVFVLDDYHVIEDKAVNDSITFFLEHMPENMHFIITTRVDPPLPLPRLRARNQLTEIRANDLRFTQSETAGFLNQRMGLKLSDRDIEILKERTEGWVAGLQLAAISMQGHADTSSFIKSFSGSNFYIMDYLIEEVLKHQPEEIQSFLLKTSILGRMCGSLCDAVMRNPSKPGQDILEYLEHANLFIAPLDNERKWYRYHQLFADLLIQKLTNGYAPNKDKQEDVISELHFRASKWFEENGYNSDSIHHALAAKDFERAAALIELSWPEADKSYLSSVWIGWVKMLPDNLIRQRPVLSAGYAWALLDTGEIESCEQWLQNAEKCLGKVSAESKNTGLCPSNIGIIDGEQYHKLPATIASARAYAASALGDTKATIKHAQNALKLSPEDDHHRRGIIAALLGLAYWTNGELDTAYKVITDAIKDKLSEVNLGVVLAELKIEQGSLLEASGIYEKSLRSAAKEGGICQINIASLYLGLAKLKFLQGDIKQAEEFLQRSKEQGEKAALPNWRYNWNTLKAVIQTSRGNMDEALDLLKEAEEYYFRSPIPDIRPLEALKARVYIKQGKVNKAIDWIKRCNLSIEDELSYLREFEHITMVRVLLAEFQCLHNREFLIQSQKLSERLLNEARKGNRTGSVIEILILQTIIYDALGESEAVEECLEEALHSAEPEGHIQVFIDEGIQIQRLLSELSVNKSITDYISKILSVVEIFRNAAGSEACPTEQQMVESLSDRELEILQLISQGLSNQEISERLFLALSTVKGYNQNIFGKLQVKKRTEAIARARELGLLR